MTSITDQMYIDTALEILEALVAGAPIPRDMCVDRILYPRNEQEKQSTIRNIKNTKQDALRRCQQSSLVPRHFNLN